MLNPYFLVGLYHNNRGNDGLPRCASQARQGALSGCFRHSSVDCSRRELICEVSIGARYFLFIVSFLTSKVVLEGRTEKPPLQSIKANGT
jgi:hypothetical protein